MIENQDGPRKFESKEDIKFQSIRILSTGGTIDSSPEYDPKAKSVFQGTYLPKLLSQVRLATQPVLEPLMQKDSADLTPEDRQMIYERVMDASEPKILITHGTDTMAETAAFLGERGVGEKVVVLVGSFIPISQENSDAMSNLEYAYSAAEQLPAGVWIAMNGQVFAWNNVRKNKEEGRFERVK